MGKGKRIRRDRADGRRGPISDRRNKLSPEEEWRREVRQDFRDKLASGFAGVEGLEGFERPPLGATREMFEPAPTDEPGTMFACEDCGWEGYLEGMFTTNSDPRGIAGAETVLPGMCPDCGGNMYSTSTIVANMAEGGIAATHPAGLRFALERLLSQVETGEVTPDDAIAELRKEPVIRRIIDLIENYPGVSTITAGFVTTLIGVLLTFLVTERSEPAPSITPEQIEQIVESVVSEMDERDQQDEQAPPQPPPHTPGDQ